MLITGIIRCFIIFNFFAYTVAISKYLPPAKCQFLVQRGGLTLQGKRQFEAKNNLCKLFFYMTTAQASSPASLTDCFHRVRSGAMHNYPHQVSAKG